jgi:hypothetical protein
LPRIQRLHFQNLAFLRARRRQPPGSSSVPRSTFAGRPYKAHGIIGRASPFQLTNAHGTSIRRRQGFLYRPKRFLSFYPSYAPLKYDHIFQAFCLLCIIKSSQNIVYLKLRRHQTLHIHQTVRNKFKRLSEVPDIRAGRTRYKKLLIVDDVGIDYQYKSTYYS